MDVPSGAAGAAEAAAEAVRALNHLTIRPPVPGTRGWQHLADVYAVVGALQALVERLPQALGQLARSVEQPGVRYGSDNDDQAGVLAARTAGHLRHAALGLAAVQAALDGAHEALSHLHVRRQLVVIDGEAAQ